MTSQWMHLPLGEVAPAQSLAMPASDSVVWNLSLEEIESGTGRVLLRQTCRVNELGSSKCVFDERHVLYSKLRPYLNKVALPDSFGVGTSELIPLRPRGDLDRDFLAFYLRSPEFLDFANANTRGANLPRIAMTELWRHRVPMPPTLTEQRRIVNRIKECMERVGEIDSLRRESLVERGYLAESLVEAQLASLDGDDVCMSDVCEITSRLIDPRDMQFQTLVHVGGANIESKTGRLIDLKTAAEENLKSGKFVFDESVVLYNKIRPYLMKVARPDFSGLCSADMYPLTPKADKATRDFIYYVLMSRRFTDYAISGSNRAGMPKVNREHLFAYRFKLPSMAVQQQISEHLDSAVDAVHSLSQELEAADIESAKLRGAILRKAFAGEL